MHSQSTELSIGSKVKALHPHSVQCRQSGDQSVCTSWQLPRWNTPASFLWYWHMITPAYHTWAPAGHFFSVHSRHALVLGWMAVCIKEFNSALMPLRNRKSYFKKKKKHLHLLQYTLLKYKITTYTYAHVSCNRRATN